MVLPMEYVLDEGGDTPPSLLRVVAVAPSPEPRARTILTSGPFPTRRRPGDRLALRGHEPLRP
jgi:hypothetical protein